MYSYIPLYTFVQLYIRFRTITQLALHNMRNELFKRYIERASVALGALFKSFGERSRVSILGAYEANMERNCVVF